jgi:hypothetical protein
MQIKAFILMISAAGFLSACNDQAVCTQEIANQKAADLTAKMTEVATADPTKMAELGPKVAELAKTAQAGGDLAAACKAMDDMMAELAK